MAEEEEVEGWIEGEESAKAMLARVLRERPLLLLPPLHRVPLRVGNVVELVGPSPSAKTQILIQTEEFLSAKALFVSYKYCTR
ncbi:DNA repair protein xrcc2 [Sarracenia purpurea var. burkii]